MESRGVPGLDLPRRGGEEGPMANCCPCFCIPATKNRVGVGGMRPFPISALCCPPFLYPLHPREVHVARRCQERAWRKRRLCGT